MDEWKKMIAGFDQQYQRTYNTFFQKFFRLNRNSADRDQLLEDDSHMILAIISLHQISQIEWV